VTIFSKFHTGNHNELQENCIKGGSKALLIQKVILLVHLGQCFFTRFFSSQTLLPLIYLKA
ncbi:spore wall protein 2, partial [Biomphalaria glabrata]